MGQEQLSKYLSGFHRQWLSEGRARPAGEPLAGAILLVDIVGLTAITQRLDEGGMRGAERLGELLEHAIGRIVDVVEAHGGDALAFAGDSVVALWPGGPGDVKWAAQAALAIQALPPDPQEPMRLRCAVGAGELTTREVGGVDGRWMLVVSGEAIDEAAAADRDAQAGDVVVGPQAWQRLSGATRGERRGAATVLLGLEVEEDPTALSWADPGVDLRPLVPRVVRDRADLGAFLAEFRRLTVLFVSLRSGADSLDALQSAVEACQTAVQHTEGETYNLVSDDKGTTFLAVWGLPGSSHEDDPARALAAAMRIEGHLAVGGVESAAGIATGRLFCGSYGNATRRHYTIVGPTVNLAARLMTAGDGVRCDDATRKAAADRAVFGDGGQIEAKGFGEPVAVHRPLALNAKVRAGGELVGRQAEREAWAADLDALAEGRGAVRLVVGEAGIGKSQLFRALVDAAELRSARVLEGAADSIGASTSWLMWAGPIQALTGGDSERLLALLGDDERLLAWAPLIQDVLDHGIEPTETTAAITGPSRGHATTELLVGLLRSAAAQKPTVLVVDDVHWLDTASWEALEAAAHVEGLLLLVGTRPLDGPAAHRWARLRELPGADERKLDSLPPADAAVLAARKLGVDALPEEAVALLTERADGHPLYAQELAWALVEGGPWCWRTVRRPGVARRWRISRCPTPCRG